MKKSYINHKLQGYDKPLYKTIDRNHGFVTHTAKITYFVYKFLNLKQSGYSWDNDFWCEIDGETEKAIHLFGIGWVPKKMVFDIREIIYEE